MDPVEASAKSVLHPKTSLVSILNSKSSNIEKGVLHQKYVVEGLSARQLADQFGVSKVTVLATLKRAEIKRHRVGSNGGRSVPPYGKKLVKGQLVASRNEQKIVRTITRLFEHDRLSVTAIARRLSEMGFVNRAGHTNWHHETIRQILKREKKLKNKC